jgi:peptide deformylase
MVKKILQQDDPVLRQVSLEVGIRSINTPKIKKILEEMSLALKSQEDGVAIAAPQIGYNLRIFVVSGKVFSEDGISTPEDIKNKKNNPGKDVVFINPKISKLSREKDWVPEGCLSVRWLYGKTYRSKKAYIEAYNEEGKKIKMGGSGLLAQIFQHETDHLNGILFIDHAKDVREELPVKK